jgi:hypothetical protein
MPSPHDLPEGFEIIPDVKAQHELPEGFEIQEDHPTGNVAAFARGIPGGAFVVGPTLKDWAQKGAAASQAILPPEGKYSHAPTYSERYNENLERERQADLAAQRDYPTATKTGGLAGAALSTLPAAYAGPAVASAAGLGKVAAPIVGGAAGFGGLSAADTLAKGGSPGEAAVSGAIGAGLGGAGGALPLVAPYALGALKDPTVRAAGLAFGGKALARHFGLPAEVGDALGDFALAKILKKWDPPASIDNKALGETAKQGMKEGFEPLKENANAIADYLKQYPNRLADRTILHEFNDKITKPFGPPKPPPGPTMYQPYRPPGAPPPSSSPIEPIPSAPPASGATPRSQPPGPAPAPPTPTRADIGRDIQETMRRMEGGPAPPWKRTPGNGQPPPTPGDEESIRRAMKALLTKPPGTP